MNRWACSTLLVLTSFINASGQVPWPWVKYSRIAQGVWHPTHIANAGDGSSRLFVTRQSGQIQLLYNNNLGSTFLDISDRVHPPYENERGLWSIAFPPGYAQSGRFYVAYSRRPDGAFLVSRFSVSAHSANEANPASEQIVLTNAHSSGYHHGGQLAFGPDGYLYVSCGDNQEPLQAQNLNSLHGKILRIDPEGVSQGYRIPFSNPFVGMNNVRPEIWSLGLRNPWRFSFDRWTGTLYIADVGERTREEINSPPTSSLGGENYGWPFWEGSHNPGLTTASPPPVPFVQPAIEYGRNLGGSVIGGHVYRGPPEPRMDGLYFFADHSSGNVWAVRRVGTNWLQERAGPNLDFINTFGEDEAGRLYVATYGGSIYRLEESGVAAPPEFDPTGYTGRDDGSYLTYTDVIRVYSPDSNDSIRYTMDGTDPGLHSPVVPAEGFVIVTNKTVLSARVWHDGLQPSEVTRRLFNLQVQPPQGTPPPGAVPAGMPIVLNCATPGAVIWYSLNGNPNASLYTSPLTFDVDTLRAQVRVRARAVRPGFLDGVFDGIYHLPTVRVPRFEPAGGRITNGRPITIICDTPGATIHFETNGALPTINSRVYTEPVALSPGVPLRAFAVRDDMYPSGYGSAQYTLELSESNVVAFAAAEFGVTEGDGSVAVHVVRRGPTAPPASVDFSMYPWSASEEMDYTPTRGTLSFAAGTYSQTISILIVLDAMSEANESFYVTLRNPTNTYLGEQMSTAVIITNNSSAGTVEFSASNYSVSENRPSANVLLKRRSGFAGDVVVCFSTRDGSAVAGGDYFAARTNIVFAAGEKRKLVSIPLRDDPIKEFLEGFYVYLPRYPSDDTPWEGTYALVNIRDNDLLAALQFERARYSVTETNANSTIAVTRTGNFDLQASVRLTSGGSFTDLVEIDQTLIFLPGERRKEIPLVIVNDGLVEGNEHVLFYLSGPSPGSKLGTPAKTMLVIEDDDSN